MTADKKSKRPKPLPGVRIRRRPEPLLSTARRAPIRVLLRAGALERIGDSVSGDAILLVGPAERTGWGNAWRAGDVEAIVWVTVQTVNATLAALREHPEIVDVRMTMLDVK
jgi:hypothetical protein